MESKFKIRIKSEDHSKAVQEKLFSLGVKWNGDGAASPTVKHLGACYLFVDAKALTYSADKGYGDNQDHKLYTIDDLYEALPDFEEVNVSINENYEATITRHNVKVGCQVFTNERIERFIKMYQKAHKK